MTTALETALGPTLAAQCRQAPEPDDLRGHVLAKLNVWVPPGQPVWQWLLDNYKVSDVRQSAPTAPVAARSIEVECTEDGTETGRCSYSADYVASGTIRISEEELHALIREAGDHDTAVDDFCQWADDNHQADDRELSDYDYDDHEASDDEDVDRSHNAREVIEAYLEEHPELLAPEAEAEELPQPEATNQQMPF